jgi:hypothetical protein
MLLDGAAAAAAIQYNQRRHRYLLIPDGMCNLGEYLKPKT